VLAELLQPFWRIHHQHRALELRGSLTLQLETALLAGVCGILVLSAAVRAKHSNYLRGGGILPDPTPPREAAQAD
jgi:hypothetical protein